MRLARLLAHVFVVFLVLFYVAKQVHVAVSRGDALSTHATYSEANDIRSGEAYVHFGFTSNCGLADIAYGTAFDRIGSKHDHNMCSSSDSCVYLHTPPGSELLAGVATRLFGAGHVARFRIVPLTIASLALAFLAWAMVRGVGPFRAAFVLWTFQLVPMITASMHNLTFINYELALFEAQLGVLILCLFERARVRSCLVALFALGFFSGWVSFDYLAHVSLIALAVGLLTGSFGRHNKTVLWCTLASCSGYALACTLHLLQVAAFLGSIQAMLDDYVQRGMARMSGQVEGSVRAIGASKLLWLYWSELLKQHQFFRGNFLLTLGLTLGALLVRTRAFRFGDDSFRWAPARSLALAVLVAFVIPNLWIVVMRQHATAHVFYLPRNFIVTFLVGALALSLALKHEAIAEPPAAIPLREDE